jgi:hypothetical protein
MYPQKIPNERGLHTFALQIALIGMESRGNESVYSDFFTGDDDFDVNAGGK